MSNVYISIPRDFSPSPAGRSLKDGNFNGAKFREEFLAPAIERAVRENSKVVVDFDGADSYSSSFLDEVFGGIVRGGRIPPKDLVASLEFKSENPVYSAYVADAKSYLQQELKKVGA